MTSRNIWLKSGALLAVMAGSIAFGNISLAQPPPGGFPGGGFGMGRGGGASTLATIPVDILVEALKLTEMQKSDAGKYQEAYKKAQQANRPDFSGGPPDPAMFQEMMKKNTELDKVFSDKIKALLTDEQKKSLPDVLKDFKTMNSARIPLGLYSKIKLTDDQKKKLDENAEKSQKELNAKIKEAQDSGDRQAMRQLRQESQKAVQEKVNEILTDDQKELIKTWRKDHPAPQRGGPGGPGGPPPPFSA